MKIKAKLKEFEFHKYYLIYIFGFLINFRPSDPFNYEFLISDSKKFMKREVNYNVYPIGIYSNAIQAVFVFLLIDLFNYNPLIVLCSISSVVYISVLTFTTSLFETQIAEAIFGTLLATELAYYIFIYTQVDVKQFRLHTAFIRLFPLIAKTLSFLLSQLIISLEWMDFQELHYITLAAMILALPFSILLPWPTDNIYHHLEKTNKNKILAIIKNFYSNFIQAFSDKYIVKWTLWFALTTCGYRQITTYIQVFWHTFQQQENEVNYNGVVEGIGACLSACMVCFAGMAKLEWRFTGDLICTVTSLVHGFMLIFLSQLLDYTLLCFVFYIVFGIVYYFTTTSLLAELAKDVKKGILGAVLGISILFGCIVQVIMVAVVNDDLGYELQPKDQFFVYGMYHFAIAFLYIIIGIASWYAKRTYPI